MENLEMSFSDNLKYYREKAGLTQRTLAEKIGMSEKSVSKWENRGGLPMVDCLISLSRVFGVSMEDLLLGIGEEFVYLGVHGGGNNTVFLLCGSDGRTIRRIERGPLNPNDLGVKTVAEQISIAVDDIRAGIPMNRIVAFFGIAGWVAEVGNQMADFVKNMGFHACGCGTDIENVTAISVGKSGIVAIMDTGFVAYAVDGNHRHRVAGWGQLFDDGGCAYNIGRDGIAAVLRYRDGSGRNTVISKFADKKAGQKINDHLSDFYMKGKKYIASFADCVFEAYEEDDSVATEILLKNVNFACQMILSAASFISERPVKVYITGCLTEYGHILLPLMKRTLFENKFELRILEEEPVFGAVISAARLNGVENPFDLPESRD